MRILIVILILLMPSFASADSESTIGGRTGTDHIIQCDGVSLRPRSYLNFTTSGSGCSDANGKTNVALGSGGSSQWTTSVNDIYSANTGNVGIGTPNPQQKLDVLGTVKATSFQVRGSSIGTVAGSMGIQFDPNYTGGSFNPTAFIQTDGNFGIGNTAPVAKFHVTGNSFFSNLGGNSITYDLNGSYFGAWYNTLTDSTLYYGASDGINTVPAIFPTILSLATDTGNVGIGTGHPNFQLDVGGTARVTGLKIPGNGVANGYVWTSTGTDGSAHWATAGAASQTPWASDIDGAGFKLTGTGNIGIGSATPGKQLDVQGTIRTTNFTLTTGAGTLECLHRSTTGVVTGTGSDCGAGSGSGTVNSGTANQAAYYATSTTAVSGTSDLIFNGSNVGIGSATPGYLLDVNGGARFNGTGDSLLNPTANNVGIGSLTPGQKLDVQGTIRATYFNNMAITAPSSSSTLAVANGKTLTASNTLTLAGTDSTVMTFPSTSATVARTDAANTFTGHQTIEGVTSTGATGTGAIVFGTGPTVSSPVITNIAPAADFTLTQNSVAAITSVNSGATVNTLYLKAGNVGIGSTSPGKSLDVQGTARMTGFQMNTGSSLNSKILTSDASGNGTWQAPTGSGGSPGGGQNAVQRNNSSAFSGDESVFSFNGTNVGIGTTNGTSLLDVRGAFSDNLTMTLNSTLADLVSYSFGTEADPVNPSQTALTLSASAGSHHFYLGPFYGINATVTTYLGATALAVNNNGDIWVLAAPGGDTMTIGPTGGTQFWTATYGPGSGSFGNLFQISGSGTAATTLRSKAISSQTGPLQDWQNSSGTTLDVISIDGNLGIGSATPGQMLDVQGTVRSLGVTTGSNCFYYCNGGVDVNVISRGSSCLCPGGSCVATNICSN